jgi:hypothetical protein
MADFTPEEEGPRAGERVVFTAWLGVIGVGLLFMLTVPLLGR